MSQALLPFRVEVIPTNDKVTGRAGLPLIVELLAAFGMTEVIHRELKIRQRSSGYREGELLEDIAMLMAAGGDCVADIKILKADGGLCRMLDRKLPSEDALFDFLYAFHSEDLIQQAKQAMKPGQKAYIPKENEALQGLGRVNAEFVRRVSQPLKITQATLDHDATIQESHKREAQPHYKGGRGYQPSAIVWAELGLAIADEYRDGNVPAGMSNLPLIKRGFSELPKDAGLALFFRADSACYEEQVLKWLANPQRESGPEGRIGFAISADMTQELQKMCKAVASTEWKFFEDREDETLEWAEVEFTPGDWPKASWPLRYVALRIRKKQGQLFASGSDTKYLAVVSNREPEMAGEAIIRWHRKKAGTIELLHDVSKNELGAAVPPSGKFGADAAWYRLSLFTLNILTALKLHALPEALKTARPKRLRATVFTLAAKLSEHAGKLIVRVGAEAEKLAGWIAARAKLAALHPFFSTV
jgi:hypothetical protein